MAHSVDVPAPAALISLWLIVTKLDQVWIGSLGYQLVRYSIYEKTMYGGTWFFATLITMVKSVWLYLFSIKMSYFGKST
jgi:hypothetical protein